MSWKSYFLGDILKRRKSIEKISPDKEYKLVKIKLYHKGVVLRSIVKGFTIKSTMSAVRTGDFILSGIDARNGAFGIVPEELNGAVVTNDFWCLEPDDKIIDKEFLLYLTSTDFFDHICKQSSDGTTQRIRLQRDKFFNYKIDLPEFTEQKHILSKLKSQEVVKEGLSFELNHQLDLVRQLRLSFLREAMQGRLVKQNPIDGNAKQLLEKITVKNRLTDISKEEIPFNIPSSWQWCRIGEIAQHNSGKTLDSGRNTGKLREYITTSNLYWGYFNLENLKLIPIEETELKKCTAIKGDLLICEGGEAGRSAIWKLEKEICFQNHIHRVRPFADISSEFIYYYFLFLNLSGRINLHRKGMGISNMSGKSLSLIPIPIPPLPEQHRLVKKIEQLMQVCDELQLNIQESRTSNENYLQVVLRDALKKD